MKNSLLKQYRSLTNEKYALQQYEGRVSDSFISDIQEIQKIAPQLMLYLCKYTTFAISRTFTFEELRCIINIVFYDKVATDDEVINSISNVINVDPSYGPSTANGFALDNSIVVWVPANVDSGPFSNEKLNELISEYDKEQAIEYIDDNRIVTAKNFSKLDLSQIKSSSKNKEALEVLFQDVPAGKITKATPYISLDWQLRLTVLKHELTHLLDNKNARKVNFYSTRSANAIAASKNVANSFDVDADEFYAENKNNFKLLLTILYRLWSYTEFNAFTQSYGRANNASYGNSDSSKRSIELNKIIKTYSKSMFNDNTSSLNGVAVAFNKCINKISNCDLKFWSAAKEITLMGCNTESAASRIRKMSPSQFKTYFIDTSRKLVEKFRDKTFKNVNTRNIYQSDIASLAREIMDKCSSLSIDKKRMSDNILTLKFDFYFKKFDQTSPVTVTFTIPYITKSERNISSINSLSGVNVSAKYLNMNKQFNALDFFEDEENNGFAEMILELYTKNRKTVMEELSLNFAEDLYKGLSELSP
jgi:hypothetical protein